MIVLPRRDAAFGVGDLPYARHRSRCHAKNTGWLGFAVDSDDHRHVGRQSQQHYRCDAMEYEPDREPDPRLAIGLLPPAAASVAAICRQSICQTPRNSMTLPPGTFGTDKTLPADLLSSAAPAASVRAFESAGASAAPWPGKST